MTLNRAQREALQRLALRDYEATELPVNPINRKAFWEHYRTVRRSVLPGPGCVMVPLWGMWIGIEPDGYSHS